MNKTQEKALDWLLQQGYKKEDISFKQYKSPNFITRDNKQYEVKRLYGTQIIFYKAQYEELAKNPKTIILVFRDNEAKPFLKFKFEEIKNAPASYKGIEINWVDLKEEIGTIRVSKKTKERLEKFGRMGEDFEKLLNRIMDKIEK
ncbi:hypothetical protein HYT56_00625 [Candidatus Woesearchaeota archaeon]|nr:hypothetical protein [Candidatus Woesearchaeota archaeon]